MTEVVAIIAAALSVVVALIRETQHRQQRADKLTAETTMDEASAASTITETVKGLLVVMDKSLKVTRDELMAVRRELDDSREQWHQREREMQEEIDRLKAQVAILIESKARGERP